MSDMTQKKPLTFHYWGAFCWEAFVLDPIRIHVLSNHLLYVTIFSAKHAA